MLQQNDTTKVHPAVIKTIEKTIGSYGFRFEKLLEDLNLSAFERGTRVEGDPLQIIEMVKLIR